MICIEPLFWGDDIGNLNQLSILASRGGHALRKWQLAHSKSQNKVSSCFIYVCCVILYLSCPLSVRLVLNGWSKTIFQASQQIVKADISTLLHLFMTLYLISNLFFAECSKMWLFTMIWIISFLRSYWSTLTRRTTLYKSNFKAIWKNIGRNFLFKRQERQAKDLKGNVNIMS